VKGSSVFALSDRGASSAFAKFIANKENESDLVGGISIDDKHPVLAQTLLDLSQSATINDSMKLGRYVLDEVGQVNTLHKKYVEQAGFAVLKAPDIPSILG
jgi:N-acetylmuramoyl-L-alanine amidase